MTKTTIRSQLEAIDTTVRRAVDAALEDAAYDAKRNYESITQRWKHKPTLQIERTIAPVRWVYEITPEGRNKKIFAYVDRGTRGPYTIPRVGIPGKLLRFQTGYQAKTAPTAHYNVGPGIATGVWVSKAQVVHPGIKAREFSQTFVDDLTPPLDIRVNASIKKAL